MKDYSGSVLLSFDSGNPAFHRSNTRPAPSNVYAATNDLYAQGQLAATATGATLTPPPQLFTYQAAPPAGGQPGATITLPFSGASPFGWTWSPTTQLYQRSQNGIGATLADGSAITANNIVILEVAITETDITDAEGNHDPLVVVTGTGAAWVLRNGVRYAGTWTRPFYAARRRRRRPFAVDAWSYVGRVATRFGPTDLRVTDAAVLVGIVDRVSCLVATDRRRTP